MTHETETQTQQPAADETVLGAVRAQQRAVVDFAQQCVDEIGGSVPEWWERELVSGGPALRDVTDAAFGLTRQVLDAQLAFAQRIVESVRDGVKKLS